MSFSYIEYHTVYLIQYIYLLDFLSCQRLFSKWPLGHVAALASGLVPLKKLKE